MKLSEIGIPYGARRHKKRVGRGVGSGHGKTSGKGHKGLKSRSGAGGKLRLGFEGGQMPLIRRIPKRGFNSKFKVINQVINIEQLNHFRKDDVVDLKKLRESNLIKTLNKPVKVLGDGDMKKPLTIYAHYFSKSALDKIAKAGGKAELISHPVKPENTVKPEKK
ncbi:MAG: 50S ribosomal protein L15 [Candidatus Omnitrophota bacterium]|nr:50S ribosomal protein L15 [Candidatus Omnitrophota bacterium]